MHILEGNRRISASSRSSSFIYLSCHLFLANCVYARILKYSSSSRLPSFNISFLCALQILLSPRRPVPRSTQRSFFDSWNPHRHLEKGCSPSSSSCYRRDKLQGKGNSSYTELTSLRIYRLRRLGNLGRYGQTGPNTAELRKAVWN